MILPEETNVTALSEELCFGLDLESSPSQAVNIVQTVHFQALQFLASKPPHYAYLGLVVLLYRHFSFFYTFYTARRLFLIIYQYERDSPLYLQTLLLDTYLVIVLRGKILF